MLVFGILSSSWISNVQSYMITVEIHCYRSQKKKLETLLIFFLFRTSKFTKFPLMTIISREMQEKKKSIRKLLTNWAAMLVKSGMLEKELLQMVSKIRSSSCLFTILVDSTSIRLIREVGQKTAKYLAKLFASTYHLY